MPNPKQDESKNDFISRFMSSDEAQRDYPDQKQRLAVAHSKWRAKKGVNMESVQKSINTINKNLKSVMKAQEGDSRMIFGKPYEFKGGEWIQTGENVKTDNAPDKLPGDEVIDTTGQMSSVNLTDIEDPMIREMVDENIGANENRYKKMFDEFQEEVNDTETSFDDFAKMQFAIEEGFEGWEDFVGNSAPSNPVQKSLNTIHKNLAGVHDALQRNGVTSTNDDHSHSYLIDRDGNGATTGMVGESSVQHIHEISNYEVAEAQNHTHYI